MKKKIIISLICVLVILFILGIFANYYDSARVRAGHEPKLVIKTYSEKYDAVIYYGLGYKIVRHIGVSPNETYESALNIKIGSWFMSNKLPETKEVIVKDLDELVLVEPYNINEIRDRNEIVNILENQKYTNEVCEGINDFVVTIDNEKYYIKENCLGIVFDGKEANISKKDMDKLLELIYGYDVLNIVDKTIGSDIICAEALEKFHEDESNEYYFNCIKNEYVIVTYKNGVKENVKDAIKNKRIDISYLDEYEIKYIKESK